VQELGRPDAVPVPKFITRSKSGYFGLSISALITDETDIGLVTDNDE